MKKIAAAMPPSTSTARNIQRPRPLLCWCAGYGSGIAGIELGCGCESMGGAGRGARDMLGGGASDFGGGAGGGGGGFDGTGGGGGMRDPAGGPDGRTAGEPAAGGGALRKSARAGSPSESLSKTVEIGRAHV